MFTGTEQYSEIPKRRILYLGRAKSVLATASEVRTLVGADTVFKFPNTPGNGPYVFVPQGGPVLAAPSIKPIFWGAEWGGANPPLSATVIRDAITAIVTGPYLSSLGQYGIGGTPSVLDPMFVLDSEPPSIATVDQMGAAVVLLLTRLIDDNQLAEPDSNWSQFNVVFLPSTVADASDPSHPTKTVLGSHSYFGWSDRDVLEGDDDERPGRYAWVATQPFGSISALDRATATFSHELVEAMTDPGPTLQWRQSPDPGNGGGEIGDVCTQFIGRLDGVAVQAYWSNADNQCVIPTRSHSARISPPAVVETSTSNGPDQIVNVDRACGRSAHWTGTYHYHVINHSLTITLTATTTGYTDPTGTWKVAGSPVKLGESTITPTLNVSFPGLPEDASATQPVTLRLVATETTLQLTNDAVDGSYDVPVSYTATERSDNLSTLISATGWATSVTVEGQTLQVPDDFNTAQAKCIRGQAASIEIHMKDLQSLIADFNQFVQTHQGPPINQEIAGGLRQASLNLATQLRVPGNTSRPQ